MKPAILAPYRKIVDVLNKKVLQLWDPITQKQNLAKDVYHYGDKILPSRKLTGILSVNKKLRKNAIVKLQDAV